jgi:hypothetical protein
VTVTWREIVFAGTEYAVCPGVVIVVVTVEASAGVAKRTREPVARSAEVATTRARMVRAEPELDWRILCSPAPWCGYPPVPVRV